MYEDRLAFRSGVVRPMVCLREAWQAIKEDYWLFLGISLVGMLIIMVGSVILMGPMMCGIHLCVLRRLHGRRVSFGMLFRGFDYFVPSLIASLIIMVPMLILIMVSYALLAAGMIGVVATFPPPQRGGPPDPAMIWGIVGVGVVYFFVLLAISIVMQVAIMFIYPLIVDRDLTGWEAVKLSARAGLANFWGIIGLMLLSTLIQLLGMLACYVGAFFLMPLGFAMITVAYEHVFAPDDLADRERTNLEPEGSGSGETAIESSERARPKSGGDSAYRENA